MFGKLGNLDMLDSCMSLIFSTLKMSQNLSRESFTWNMSMFSKEAKEMWGRSLCDRFGELIECDEYDYQP